MTTETENTKDRVTVETKDNTTIITETEKPATSVTIVGGLPVGEWRRQQQKEKEEQGT